MSVNINYSGDPIEYFLEEQRLLGNAPKSISEYDRILHDFQDFCNEAETNPTGESVSLSEANRRVCMAWVNSLRNSDKNLSGPTIATYASKVNSFYQYLSSDGIFDANPMDRVVEMMDESIDSEPVRREISVDEMAEFVQTLKHPYDQAVILTFLKTGIRAGELVNLDIRDVHIDDPVVKDAYPEMRSEIKDREDSIFIQSDIGVGDLVNGAERKSSNKRERDTIIPIDEELKSVLIRWLDVRPDAVSQSDPLFINTKLWGFRSEYGHVRKMVINHTEENGWYDSGANANSNVTPHYFRHFFTTHVRRRTNDETVVRFIRGDLSDDILDTYTHDWGNKIRDEYEASIYKLL